ncbi:MAG: asparagine synthase (glutamine-hydrolyzing) [Pseudomonadota bacterium]
MCGISGIINKNGAPVSRDELLAMNDLASHRGPDGGGLFLLDNLGFGHRRLAILDLSSSGRQPMIYKGSYVLTYNGEIYNYLELKKQLRQYGYVFTSETDTEVILAAYDKWGSDCVSRFNGMWSFSLFDIANDLIFCSRDRFGIKPFYYSNSDQRFVFGSEIKQVLLGAKIDPVANLPAVRDFLVEGYHGHTNDSFFQQVHSLKAGHNLLYSLKSKRFLESRYYDLSVRFGLPEMKAAEATELLLKDFKRAIGYQLRADVKVGVCLSGGLDSSCIAGLSASLYNAATRDRMQAIHAKSSEANTDESCFAQQMAKFSHIDLTIVQPAKEDFTRAMDEVVYCQEEPFATPSIFMQYFAYQAAKQAGCKVMLDGQGCDEILLGYERYYAAHLWSMPILSALKEVFAIGTNSRLSLGQIVGNLLYFSISGIRIKRLKRRAGYLKDEHTTYFPNIKKLTAGIRDIHQMQKMEIESFQLPHLLRYLDRNSMRHSIEARVPFLDHELVDTCFGINSKLKIRCGWTKHVLRNAMHGLIPENILWRKNKFGFEAPVTTWIEHAWKDMAQAIAKSRLLDSMCLNRLDFNKIDRDMFWRLYCVARWEAVFHVQLGDVFTPAPFNEGSSGRDGLACPVPQMSD